MDNIELRVEDYSILHNGQVFNLYELYPVKADHARDVINNALEIAQIIGMEDQWDRVFVAGLLHDVMKAQARATMQEQGGERALIPMLIENVNFYKDFAIFIDDGIQGDTSNYWITHAPQSAVYTIKKFGIDDEEVLWAIAHHQHGREFTDYKNMLNLEKIIMLADYIDKQEAEYEQLAIQAIKETKNLDLAMFIILTGTIQKESIRDDKLEGAIPNGNLVMIWKLLSEDYAKDQGFMDSIRNISNEIFRYLERETITTARIAKHYTDRKTMDREAFLVEVKHILQERGS